MSYYPIKAVDDMSNPSDRNSYITIQGLINALALYNLVTSSYSRSQIDGFLAAKEDVSNKSTGITLGTSDTLYPTQNAVKSYVDTQSALKENVANKSTSTTLASASNTTYPSTLAVKTYIDTQDALKENLTNKSTDGTFASPNNTTYPSTLAVSTFVATAVKGNYQEVTTNITMSAGMRYYVNAGSGNTLTLTLPAVFNQDDSFFIFGKTGTFKIAQQSGQTIRSVQGSTTTGTGGSITSTNQYSTLTLRGLIANSEILITTQQGVYNVV